jgi:hypothetical protein
MHYYRIKDGDKMKKQKNIIEILVGLETIYDEFEEKMRIITFAEEDYNDAYILTDADMSNWMSK